MNNARKHIILTELASFIDKLDKIEVSSDELAYILDSLESVRFGIEKQSEQNFIENEEDKALSLSTSTI